MSEGVFLTQCASVDFAQLPPVGGDKYCFLSPRWSEAVTRIVVLKEVVRQRETALIAALNQVRLGTLDATALQLFNSRVGKATANAAVVPTKLSSKKKDVAAENLGYVWIFLCLCLLCERVNRTYMCDVVAASLCVSRGDSGPLLCVIAQNLCLENVFGQNLCCMDG